jgi:hypothetical protein
LSTFLRSRKTYFFFFTYLARSSRCSIAHEDHIRNLAHIAPTQAALLRQKRKRKNQTKKKSKRPSSFRRLSEGGWLLFFWLFVSRATKPGRVFHKVAGHNTPRHPCLSKKSRPGPSAPEGAPLLITAFHPASRLQRCNQGQAPQTKKK